MSIFECVVVVVVEVVDVLLFVRNRVHRSRDCSDRHSIIRLCACVFQCVWVYVDVCVCDSVCVGVCRYLWVCVYLCVWLCVCVCVCLWQ